MAKTRIDIPNSKTTPVFDDVLNDQDFFKDVDQAFTRIQMRREKSKPASLKAKSTKPAAKVLPSKNKKTSKDELKEVHSTFKSLIQNHLSPVVRYLKAIDLGMMNKDLTEIMEYICAPIINKSKSVGLADETKSLIDFQRSLKKINQSEGTRIASADANDLLKKFEAVVKNYGLVFRGHSTAVINVVGFYKAIKRKGKFNSADLRKLFSIGIPSLSMLRRISVKEMSSLTGLAAERCEELREESRKFTVFVLVD